MEDIRAWAGRYRWHLSAGSLALVVALIALGLSIFGASGGNFRTIFGQRLTPRGQAVYRAVASRGVERDQREQETLPPALAKKLAEANQSTALAGTVGPSHPLTLATPEPISVTHLVQNFSSRHGNRPALLVVHDTESPNAPRIQDLLAITAWFNNPRSQASSNYTTDADGNTVKMVPEVAKAWTQAFFNSWSISDELIGYASQKTWPEAQLRAAAQIFAASSARWGIPVQHALVSGCTILRPGIIQHSDLGQCGGGHHDAGPAFPIAHFIALVAQYRNGGYHPVKNPAEVLRTHSGYYAWLAWRLGEGPWKHYGRANPAARPHVAAHVPATWWAREHTHLQRSKS